MAWFSAKKVQSEVTEDELVPPSIEATKFIERQFKLKKYLTEAKKDNYVDGMNMTKFVKDLIDKMESDMKKHRKQIKTYCETDLLTPKAHEERKRSDAKISDPSTVLLYRSLHDREVVEDQNVASSGGRPVFVITDDQLKSVLSDTEMKVNELEKRRKRICDEIDRRVDLARTLFAAEVVAKF